ncbi:MAG: alpha-ketoacid dehydrogenase subunit beta [Deltaproteobacteria bacterium]|nr:alpha-ketoacid dehydrogenase subunit beta [Deltaproteobacteria bacterium]
MRELTFREAISEALVQAMRGDQRIFIMGVGVDDPKGAFGTTSDALKQFGGSRVFDVPISENAMTGIAIGSAMDGLHPVLVHARNDFLLLTMDQLVNNAAKWSYMTAGKISVPMTVRAVIGRGWGQAAQHSQSLQALFAHVPGLKVVLPGGPFEAKGLLMSSLKEKAPVIFLEHRWLYEKKDGVPQEPYSLPLGKGRILRQGKDITIVAMSYMAWECRQVSVNLARQGIEAELIDPMTVSPLDVDIIVSSVRKTGRLLVVDTSFVFAGMSAEIVASVSERAGPALKSPVQRLGLPFAPTPCSAVLERVYYPDTGTIEQAVLRMLQNGSLEHFNVVSGKGYQAENPSSEWNGPF